MFGFLAPAALLGMALLAVPILLHLFKPKKVRRTPFSSLRWLRASQQRLSKRIQAGSIIALHDGTDPFGRRNPQSTIDALPQVIADVRKQGLEFVRLDELIEAAPYR